MKGKAKVVKTLNDLLAGELTAVDQYFVHSRMYEDWGLHKLYERLDHEREEETDHADQMIKRIFVFGRQAGSQQARAAQCRRRRRRNAAE